MFTIPPETPCIVLIIYLHIILRKLIYCSSRVLNFKFPAFSRSCSLFTLGLGRPVVDEHRLQEGVNVGKINAK